MAENSGAVPQEMIYLHLDNTSYYRGDRIYFACYLVTSGNLAPSNLSQTVYVELLNPSGKVIDKCVHKAQDGLCHGSLLANETPFYSGYYEIRAYTKYMLNFGEEAIFSRVIPIYNEDHSMRKYGAGQLAFNRPKPAKAENVNAKFYPESGHLVAGLPSTVAFELTDEHRRPVEAEGNIIDTKDNSLVAKFATSHLGRGTFEFIPQAGHKYRADFLKYSVDLPAVEPEGINLAVKDNMITVRRTEDFPAKVVGVSFMCRGELYSRAILDLTDEPTATFGIPRKKLPTGVIQVTLFDAQGNVLADRLFFNNKHDYVTASYEFASDSEAGRLPSTAPIELSVKLSEPRPFSISVTDADDEVEYGSNLLANLLLASEIKGYVHNPVWYFEGEGREGELDNLLMLQGWRRYPWRHLAGFEAVDLKDLPEQGIEVHGAVMGRYRDRAKQNVVVSAVLFPIDSVSPDRDDVRMDEFMTDSLGQFSFRTDITGNWVLSLCVKDADKKKQKKANHRIMLNRSEQPEARRYDAAEMFVETAKPPVDTVVATTDDEDAYMRELDRRGVRRLKEVEVTADGGHAAEVRHYLENSVASYDVAAARQLLQDSGEKYIRRVSEILPHLDPNFTRVNISDATYKGLDVLYVIEDGMGGEGKIVGFSDYDDENPADLPVDLVKNVYINTQNYAIIDYALKYFEGRGSMMDDCGSSKITRREAPVTKTTQWGNDSINHDYRSASFRQLATERFGCVVFVEINGNARGIIRPGLRRTLLEGYTQPVEFYSPDYSQSVPDEEDYRRTLYWNPFVEPDSTGRARLRFYNNSTAKKLNVSTATFPF